MAPSLVDTISPSTQTTNSEIAFPDGLKTSGQHPPIYNAVRSYHEFPKEIVGPTVWKAADYRDSPGRWIYHFTPEEVAEISAAADGFIAANIPLTGITRDLFPLPTLSSRMDTLRNELIDGQGFWLFRGLPVQDWDLRKCASAYMGLGTYLGYFVSQNGRGHVLGHVKDLGEDPSKTDRVRIYRTNARQFFHTDGSDIVGLLCIAQSFSGGESDIASTHHVFNELQKLHPDVVKTLAEPNWYFDRKGEVSEGEEQWIRGSIWYLENDPKSQRVYAKFDPNNVTSLARFNSGPNAVIQPLSEEQKYAMKVFEETCARVALHMILAPGDIQFVSNAHVFHSRTAYQDHPPGAVDEDGNPVKRRHLMRLWLSTPESEGGWKLPFHDSKEKKRGGIQVNDTPPVCPLDAE